MVNDEFQKDISRHLAKNTINTELEAGATARRYDPVGGIAKHNNNIHKESSFADKYKNLPFSFSKPKEAVKTVSRMCGNCKAPVSVSINCVSIICSKCKQYSSIIEVA